MKYFVSYAYVKDNKKMFGNKVIAYDETIKNDTDIFLIQKMIEKQFNYDPYVVLLYYRKLEE